MSDFERVKEKVDLYDVASRYTHLKKRGKEYLGLCPLHSEKSGSFAVNREKGQFYCYGCGAGGDVFELVRLKENTDLYTALEMLAAEKGIQLSSQDDEGYQKRREFQRKQSELVQAANNKVGKKAAVDYILGRGLSQASVTKFMIGYGEKNHSIVIPLYDHRNLPIGYAERFIGDPPPGFSGKYRLPSEDPKSPLHNELFKKSQFLYNEYNARKALKKEQYLLVFEGQFDAIAADQIGFPASIAYMQASMTPDQAKRIVKLAEDNTVIVLVPDKNASGIESVRQNTELIRALNPKALVKVMRLPNRQHDGVKHWDMNDFVKDGIDRETAEGLIDIVEVALLELMMTKTPDIHMQHEYACEIAATTENPFMKERISAFLAEQWDTDAEHVDKLLRVKRQAEIYKDTKDIDALYDAYISRIFTSDQNNLTLGYPALDKVINSGMGIPTGWVVNFVARSSVGKTAFALNVISNTTQAHGVGCTFFSFEQQDSDLYPKIAAIRTDTSQRRIFDEYANFNGDTYHEAVRASLKGKLLIYEKQRLTLAQMEEIISMADEQYFQEVPQRVVLVDYLGYIKANGMKDKYESMSEMTAEIKQLAKRTKKLFVILVQTSRKGGDGSSPVAFDDARDSGTIEENSDILLGAYRPDLDQKLGSRELIEVLDDYMIQLLKNRNGPSGVTFRFKFDKPQQIIRPWHDNGNEKQSFQYALIDSMSNFGSEEERILYLREGRTSQ